MEQLTEESPLRGDSQGEFCSVGESLTFLVGQSENELARVLGRAVDVATQSVRDDERSPKPKVGQTANRNS